MLKNLPDRSCVKRFQNYVKNHSDRSCVKSGQFPGHKLLLWWSFRDGKQIAPLLSCNHWDGRDFRTNETRQWIENKDKNEFIFANMEKLPKIPIFYGVPFFYPSPNRGGVKKLWKSGQADRLGWHPPLPPSPEAVRVLWFFQNKLTYFDLFCHFIMGKIGPKFSHLLTVRAKGADPPPLRSAWP